MTWLLLQLSKYIVCFFLYQTRLKTASKFFTCISFLSVREIIAQMGLSPFPLQFHCYTTYGNLYIIYNNGNKYREKYVYLSSLLGLTQLPPCIIQVHRTIISSTGQQSVQYSTFSWTPRQWSSDLCTFILHISITQIIIF